MPQITLVLPVLEGGAVLDRCLAALQRQSLGDFLVLVCPNGRPLAGALPEGDPRFRLVADEFRNLASMKAALFLRWPAPLVAELPEGLELAPEALERAVLGLKTQPGTGAFYGHYREISAAGERLIEPRLHPGDLTERVNTGPLVVMSHGALMAAGNYDPAFNTAHEYDLRLRMQERHPWRSLGAVLGTIRPRPADSVAARQLGASKVFSPGEGPQGGFSYLFYGPAEEMEFETAFKNYLRSHDAYLSHAPAVVRPVGEPGAVSVVIPFHNRGRFLDRAIASVLEGGWPRVEILCVDNCSTDDGAAVVSRWAAREPRVRLLANDRNVIARALNLGVRHATGRYIAQLDSDDEYTPRTLAAAVAGLEANPCWGLAVSYYELISEEGEPLTELGIIKHLEYDPNNHLRVDGAGAVRVWHRAVIEELGGFDEEHYGDFAEDYDLVARAVEKYELGRLHEVLYRYRRHPDNTDVKRSAEMKIGNKTSIRHEAVARRAALNRRLRERRSDG
jgi:glycosyltransferase involved in cell wall biosynthesis